MTPASGIAKESIVSPGVMAHGLYNQNLRLQASGIAAALPLWKAAAARVTLDDTAKPLVLADYGCSQGGNSLLPMDIAIGIWQQRLAKPRPISVFHVDQPLNDFNCLVQVLSSHPERYARNRNGVFSNVIGRSFYEQVLPENSVDLGWSSYAALWLSRAPALIPGHIFAACATGEARAAFERQAAEDWQTFLRMRACEMRRGGRLVAVIPTIPAHGKHSFTEFVNAANALLGDLVGEGIITAEERRRMVLLNYPRTSEELMAPFSSGGGFHGLRVEEFEMEHIDDPAWLDYQANGDAHALAKARSDFFTAVFTPSLEAALDGRRQGEFAARLHERLMRRMLQEPMAAESAVQTMVLVKQAEA